MKRRSLGSGCVSRGGHLSNLGVLAFSAFVALGTPSPASAEAVLSGIDELPVTIDWVTVGDPGNACDTQSQGCFGAVAETYLIAKYEVTNAQYAEFLNAKAASDPLALYNTQMGSSSFGGITRSGSSGSFTYNAKPGREDMPVNFVSFYDALRFANWLHNGQGTGDTETGAYTLLGGTPEPSNGTTVTRNTGATIFLPSEDEWYKAAYHNGVGLAATDYFDYPAGSDTQTTCSTPTATPNRANCFFAVANFTDVGSYTGSASPYGTFDQGGNVSEWNEAEISNGLNRGFRGGNSNNIVDLLAASMRRNTFPLAEGFFGFRVASVVPEVVMAVHIDIRPGSDLNPVNPMSRGVIPVAILGSDTFDVADVDVTTLAFGPNGAGLAHQNGPHVKDADNDGLDDLLAHFLTAESGIAFGDEEACLTGETLDGTPFEGCDTIRTVPACGTGYEAALLLPPLMWARRRLRR